MTDEQVDRRSTWFDELLEGGGPLPPALQTLGFALTSLTREPAEVEASFQGRPEFANLLGGIQGGFLAAMVDGVVSCALLATMPTGHFAPTLELKLNYLRPVPVGTVTGRGRVVHRGSSIAFLAGELFDADGSLTTTATATAKMIKRR